MAANRNNGPELPKRKVSLETWANRDRTPNLPTPGQTLGKKKGKTD